MQPGVSSVRAGWGIRLFLAAALAAGIPTASPVHAQLLCDVDGDGLVSDVDGVNVLRAAALLSSACTLARCDTDGDGAITDVDGVNTLRAAAGLGSTCGTPLPQPTPGDGPEVTEFVTGIRGDGGQPATLRIGAAPIPQPGAPTTIEDLDGTDEVEPSGSGSATFGITDAGSARIAGVAGGAVLVRVRDQGGTVATNFYELAVAGSAVGLDFDVADLDGGTSFFLDFATRDAADVVSTYATLEVQILCIVPLFFECDGGSLDGELCNPDPCESGCNPRPCDQDECPDGGECTIVLEPVGNEAR